MQKKFHTEFNNKYTNLLHLPNFVYAQHSVHPTGGSLRVFGQFLWLGVGSVKMALSRPAHQRVTPAVGHSNGRIRVPWSEADDSMCLDVSFI